MAYLARPWEPARALERLTSWKIDQSQYVLAASNSASAVHLYGLEKLGDEELLVPICSLNLFGYVSEIECIQNDLGEYGLVLLRTGQLGILHYENGRLQILRWITALEDSPDDPALFLSSYENFVAVGSLHGNIALLRITSAPAAASPQERLIVEHHPYGTIPVFPTEVAEHEKIPDWPGVTPLTADFMLWIGVQFPKEDEDEVEYELTLTEVHTRIAAVSWSKSSSNSASDISGEPSSTNTPRLRWIGGHIEGRALPMPAPFSGCLSTLDPEILSCAARFAIQIKCKRGPETHAMDTIDPRCLKYHILPSGGGGIGTMLPGGTDAFTCAVWELEDSETGTDAVLLAGSEAGYVYKVTRSGLVGSIRKALCPTNGLADNKRVEDSNAMEASQNPAEEEGFVEMLGVSEACSLGAEIVAITRLGKDRIVCLTDDYALVLLGPESSTEPSAMPSRQGYSILHILQGSGPIVACTESYDPANPAIIAARAGTNVKTLMSHPMSPPKIESSEKKGDEELVGSMEGTEDAIEADSVAAAAEEATTEGAEGNEENAFGGAAAFGSPGALVTINSDVVLERMFESGIGEVEGTTGVFPLLWNGERGHHSAVLLSSTNSSKVLSIRGGEVFVDVTEAHEFIQGMETLASGDLSIQGWIAQVTPLGVRAVCLAHSSPSSSASGSCDWQPPAGSSISNGAVSEGIVVVQYMHAGKHTLAALALETSIDSSTSVSFVELGTLELSREASCIGNLVVSPTKPTAALVVGTYAPSILLLELSLQHKHSAAAPAAVEQPGIRVLGEVDIARYSPSTYSHALAPDSTHQMIPGSPLAAAKRPGRDTAGAGLPASVCALVADSPLNDAQSGAVQNVDPSNSTNALDYRSLGLELWVSTRSGDIILLHLQPPAAVQSPQQQQQQQRVDTTPRASNLSASTSWGPVSTLHSRSIKHSNLPPVLCLLPSLSRLGRNYAALAISDRASLLRTTSGGGGIEELRIQYPGITHGACLVLETPSSGTALFLLAASSDGVLSLSSLEAHQRSRVTAWPLPWQPVRVATHPSLPDLIAVAGWRYYNLPDKKWHNRAVTLSEKKRFVSYISVHESGTGNVLYDFNDSILLGSGESISGLAVIPPEFWEESRNTFLKDHGQGFEDIMPEIKTKYTCFILASTRTREEHSQGRNVVPGRLLLFGCPEAEQEQGDDKASGGDVEMDTGSDAQLKPKITQKRGMELINQLLLPSEVTSMAVSTGRYENDTSGSNRTSNLSTEGTLVMFGMKKRFAVYRVGWNPLFNEYNACFTRLAALAVNSEITCIKLPETAGNRPDLVLTGSGEGFTSYLYDSASVRDGDEVGEEFYQAHVNLAAHDNVARKCIDVAFFEGALEDTGVLAVMNELKMRQMSYKNGDDVAQHYNLGEPGAALLTPAIRPQEKHKGSMIAVTNGGGVFELDKFDEKHPITQTLPECFPRLLLALRDQILGHPAFQLHDGAARFLHSRMDRETKRPLEEVFVHSDPAIGKESALPEGPETATAEGPQRPAISIEQPELAHLLEEIIAETPTKQHPESAVISGELLRLFLGASRSVQHDLVTAADPQGEWMPGATVDVKTAALVYELSQLGVHLN